MYMVHGDVASQNILIHSKTFDVKLIDFDLTRVEGTMMIACGNPDFMSKALAKAMSKGEEVEASGLNDLYSLGLCCFMLLGDDD